MRLFFPIKITLIIFFQCSLAFGLDQGQLLDQVRDVQSKTIFFTLDNAAYPDSISKANSSTLTSVDELIGMANSRKGLSIGGNFNPNAKRTIIFFCGSAGYKDCQNDANKFKKSAKDINANVILFFPTGKVYGILSKPDYSNENKELQRDIIEFIAKKNPEMIFDFIVSSIGFGSFKEIEPDFKRLGVKNIRWAILSQPVEIKSIINELIYLSKRINPIELIFSKFSRLFLDRKKTFRIGTSVSPQAVYILESPDKQTSTALGEPIIKFKGNIYKTRVPVWGLKYAEIPDPNIPKKMTNLRDEKGHFISIGSAYLISSINFSGKHGIATEISLQIASDIIRWSGNHNASMEYIQNNLARRQKKILDTIKKENPSNTKIWKSGDKFDNEYYVHSQNEIKRAIEFNNQLKHINQNPSVRLAINISNFPASKTNNSSSSTNGQRWHRIQRSDWSKPVSVLDGSKMLVTKIIKAVTTKANELGIKPNDPIVLGGDLNSQKFNDVAKALIAKGYRVVKINTTGLEKDEAIMKVANGAHEINSHIGILVELIDGDCTNPDDDCRNNEENGQIGQDMRDKYYATMEEILFLDDCTTNPTKCFSPNTVNLLFGDGCILNPEKCLEPVTGDEPPKPSQPNYNEGGGSQRCPPYCPGGGGDSSKETANLRIKNDSKIQPAWAKVQYKSVKSHSSMEKYNRAVVNGRQPTDLGPLISK